jgi:hypothetical protein
MTFLDAVLAGEISPDAIDDYVGRWHQSDTKMSLPSFLGLTEEEYHNWVADPDTLEHIIAIQRMVRAARISITSAVAKASGRLN